MSINKPYTLRDIENGLRNPHYYYASAQQGNLNAMDHLADSRLALEKAEPTAHQLRAMRLVWQQEHTLQEAGELIGVSGEAVRFNLQLLSVKLKKVVDQWAEREYADEFK